mmetsp:Transcript_146835/g.381593  ORF Transcript_146835/g.381593 Transcript_146835/m.381593 type:complete len:100 (+) Transcript_146835:487-786(+)
MGPPGVRTPLVAFLLAVCHPQPSRLRGAAAVMGGRLPKKVHAAMPPKARLLGVGIWELEVVLSASLRLDLQHADSPASTGSSGAAKAKWDPPDAQPRAL